MNMEHLRMMFCKDFKSFVQRSRNIRKSFVLIIFLSAILYFVNETNCLQKDDLNYG